MATDNNLLSLNYKGYDIEQRNEGFKPLPNVLGKVTSFWVTNEPEGIRSIFAFAYSFLDALAYSPSSEESLLQEAVTEIKTYIDKKKIEDLEEYTFEYKVGKFIYVKDASWWQKDLKRILKNKTLNQ